MKQTDKWKMMRSNFKHRTEVAKVARHMEGLRLAQMVGGPTAHDALVRIGEKARAAR